jgi:hypothetical protein
MFDIATDIFRAVLTGAIFLSLRAMRGKGSPHLRKAWLFFMVGFGLLFFGGLLSVADNFPALHRYLAFGRHHYADFLEQIIGYLFGLLLVGIGFWHWIPAILALRAEEIALRESQAELKQRVVALTAERDALKARIECELGYAALEPARRPAGQQNPP